MIIYGKNSVFEAIKAKRKIYKLYIDRKITDIVFINKVKNLGTSFDLKSKEELNKIISGVKHQGVIADVEDYEVISLDKLLQDKPKRLMILDSIEDPHNFGAIIRTLVAANYDGIVMSKKQQVQISNTVVKVSSGAIEYCKIATCKNLFEGIEKLKKIGYQVVGTDQNAEREFDCVEYTERTAFVLGNEGKGLRKLVKKKCNFLVRIPMQKNVQSLNVSVAAALLMYQSRGK